MRTLQWSDVNAGLSVGHACRYTPLVRSGDKVGDYYFGWLTDKNGEGIMLEGEKFISNGAGAFRFLPFSPPH